MRIVRFVGEDGRIHHGEDRGNGSAVVLIDPHGILGGDQFNGVQDLLRDKRAIIADDDDNMRDLMATTLRKVGCQCIVCSDGRQAIAAIREQPVDLVVSDIVMPHHNGYEIFSAAKARGRGIPVVLVTGFGYDPNHVLVKAAREGLSSVLYKPFTPQQLLEEVDRAVREEVIDPAIALKTTGQELSIRRALSPLHPRDIICVGRNYAAPGADSVAPKWDELEVFMKPSSTVIAGGEPIRLPVFDEGTDPLVAPEGELAIVIGSAARDLASPEDAQRHILGYTAANDVTALRWQTAEGTPRWMRGKGFATFCPLGPAIVTRDALPNLDDLLVETRINGTTVRSGRTSQMLHRTDAIVWALSRHLTLEPGTVILTGGPPPVPGLEDKQRYLKPHDEVIIEIEGIGQLANVVEAGR